MKLLLIGGAGQVGQALRRSLAPLGPVVVSTRDGLLPDGGSCESLNLQHLDTIAPLIARVGPDAVVNASAYTAVDRAESEPELAFRINAEAPARLAAVCAMRGIPLLHYSTDYVFDGNGTRPYREDDATAPTGIYGASKLAGEQAIAACDQLPRILCMPSRCADDRYKSYRSPQVHALASTMSVAAKVWSSPPTCRGEGACFGYSGNSRSW